MKINWPKNVFLQNVYLFVRAKFINGLDQQSCSGKYVSSFSFKTLKNNFCIAMHWSNKLFLLLLCSAKFINEPDQQSWSDKDSPSLSQKTLHYKKNFKTEKSTNNNSSLIFKYFSCYLSLKDDFHLYCKKVPYCQYNRGKIMIMIIDNQT